MIMFIILLRKWYSYFLTVKKESKLNVLTLRNHSCACLSFCNAEFPESYFFSMNLINSFIYFYLLFLGSHLVCDLVSSCHFHVAATWRFTCSFL